MTISEYSKQRQQKGMNDLAGVVKTGVKAGVSIARAVAGDWVGAVGMWVPDIAKSVGDAKGMFDKWKAGQAASRVPTSSPSYSMDWWKGRA